MQKQDQNSQPRHTALTPAEKEELMRRRQARLAAERGERPAQPLTEAQKKRLAQQREAEQKAHQQQQQQEKQKKRRQKQAKKQKKQQIKERKAQAKQQEQKGKKQRQLAERGQAQAAAPPPRAGSRSAARKVRRRRTIITVSVLLVFVIVGAVLSVTVLFKIDSYRVEGDCVYTQQQLTDAFGHQTGENMFRFSQADAEARMQQALPYLETLKVRRRLPGTVVFLVSPATEYAAVELGDGNAVILSSTLRVLSASAPPADGLVRIAGYTPVELTPGSPVTSGDETKDAQLAAFIDALQKSGLASVTAIDVTDQYELTASYAGRMTIRLGTSSQLEYKLSVVEKTLEAGLANGTFTDASTGTLDASTAGTVYYRP